MPYSGKINREMELLKATWDHQTNKNNFIIAEQDVNHM
jgi:hypothetical protein